MKYKSITVTQIGGPEVMKPVEYDLRLPKTGEVRIKILSAGVCRPDISARSGDALNSGTPIGQKPPFVTGYSVIGNVVLVTPELL